MPNVNALPGTIAGTTGAIPAPGAAMGSSVAAAVSGRTPSDPSVLADVLSNSGASDNMPDDDRSVGELGDPTNPGSAQSRTTASYGGAADIANPSQVPSGEAPDNRGDIGRAGAASIR